MHILWCECQDILGLQAHLRLWSKKSAKAKKVQGIRKAMRDAYLIDKIPSPEKLKEGVMLAMTDIQQLLADYLELKNSRGRWHNNVRLLWVARACHECLCVSQKRHLCSLSHGTPVLACAHLCFRKGRQ